MVKYECIELTKVPKIKDFENFEEYLDGYYSLVLQYPLIFLPDNNIIFWGFKAKLLKNEYQLLKEVIKLNTNNPQETGYTEEEILENIAYSKSSLKMNKRKAYQRFIITSTSRIKKALKISVIECCLSKIIANKYNPFIEGKEKEHSMKKYIKDVLGKNFSKLTRQDEYIEKCTRIICQKLENDKEFEKKVLKADLNLVKIFSYMLNYTKPYNTPYASFTFNKRFSDLITPVKEQKQKSEHKRFITTFVFCSEIKYFPNDSGYLRLKEKEKKKESDNNLNFVYAKTTPTKFNLYNFVNYPKYIDSEF